MKKVDEGISFSNNFCLFTLKVEFKHLQNEKLFFFELHKFKD